MNELLVAGLILEISGLLMAGYGYFRTFRQFAAPGQRMWSPAVSRLRRTALSTMSRIDQWMRHVLGRPRNRTIAVGDSAFGFGSAANARVTTTYGRIRRPWDHEGALVQLHERTNELRRMIEDAQYVRAEEGKKLQESIAGLQSRLDDELGRVREERRAEALSDSRWQFGGFLLILFGLVLQTFGQLAN